MFIFKNLQTDNFFLIPNLIENIFLVLTFMKCTWSARRNRFVYSHLAVVSCDFCPHAACADPSSIGLWPNEKAGIWWASTKLNCAVSVDIWIIHTEKQDTKKAIYIHRKKYIDKHICTGISVYSERY